MIRTRTRRLTKDAKGVAWTSVAAIAICVAIGSGVRAARTTLDIYFIDVEGGQATLFVTPAGQSLLVDTGFPGTGTFESLPEDPAKARDAPRILAAARDAGITRIDYVLITHFHADHDGGIVELSRLMPLGAFVDHGTVLPIAEETSKGTLAAFDRYASVRATGRRLQPAPGARLPLNGVEAIVVSAAGATIAKPLAGAGATTPGCQAMPQAPDEPHENPRSTGFQLSFGRFRILDLGDLTGRPLYDLACPGSRVGPVDVYLVAHHAGADAADPATFAAFRPRVALFNNGATKGGAPQTFATVHATASVDGWQLHRSMRPGAQNFADDRIANLDETTSHWIKISASRDGSFTVTNRRTGQAQRYARH